MRYYDHFVIPFTVAVIVLAAVVGYKFVRWIWIMPAHHKQKIRSGIFTRKTVDAIGETFMESLFHRKIFRVNPLLGYMHMSLALGWFLLIVFGWVEASMHLPGSFVPLYAHVFFKFFAPTGDYRTSATVLGFIMDLLLLFVLSGVALAWFKRLRSRALGMKRTTKHTTGDRVALSALWLIFPARLIAESAVSGIKGTHTFLTGNLGNLMVDTWGLQTVYIVSSVSWWVYSIVLAVFLISFPFSRYMHIFTEVPLIFLRRYGIRSSETGFSGFDNFQIEACSRCGICIDPCQLQRDAGINGVQSAYFLRDRRYNRLERSVADNCLMCGRCDKICPVGIDLRALRQNSRAQFTDIPSSDRYNYLTSSVVTETKARVGYFAGCMTHLSPVITASMVKIFQASGTEYIFLDPQAGICCGRPLKLSGEMSAARKLMEANIELFHSSGIKTLVTPCPICLKVFREDYCLEGIEIVHHSQFIERLLAEGRLETSPTGKLFTYHDPCELGRGSGVYDSPRNVISAISQLAEPLENRENSPCCGASLANMELGDRDQRKIARPLVDQLTDTGADTIVTACPLCKKSLARESDKIPVKDIAETVAANISYLHGL